MAYYLNRFGDTNLPLYDPAVFAGTGEATLRLIDLPGGGAYDQDGSSDNPIQAHRIRANYMLSATSIATLKTDFLALRALVGTKARLYRQFVSDATVQWCNARLVAVEATNKPEYLNDLPVRLEFINLDGIWYGQIHDAGWVLDDGYYLDTGLYLDSADFQFTLTSSPQNCSVTNGGHAPVDNSKITITAGSAQITQVVLERQVSAVTQEKIKYTGTVASGNKLVIDVGAWSVTNNGTDAFSGLSIESGHLSDVWLRLAAGSNTISVTLTGGSNDSTILFEFSDAWK